MKIGHTQWFTSCPIAFSSHFKHIMLYDTQNFQNHHCQSECIPVATSLNFLKHNTNTEGQTWPFLSLLFILCENVVPHKLIRQQSTVRRAMQNTHSYFFSTGFLFSPLWRAHSKGLSIILVHIGLSIRC